MSVFDLDALDVRTRDLLASPSVSEPTRRALQARMANPAGAPRAFTAEAFATLEAVSLRLIPEPALVERIALAARLDARLAEGRPRGWRYAEAPADLDLLRAGLGAVERQAQAEGRPFAGLEPSRQDAILQAASEGRPEGAGVALDLWFEELLSALVELYYAHPLVQVAIGYDGMADQPAVLAVSPHAIAKERA